MRIKTCEFLNNRVAAKILKDFFEVEFF